MNFSINQFHITFNPIKILYFFFLSAFLTDHRKLLSYSKFLYKDNKCIKCILSIRHQTQNIDHNMLVNEKKITDNVWKL